MRSERTTRWIPQSGIAAEICQKVVQHPEPVRESHVGVQYHVKVLRGTNSRVKSNRKGR